MHAFERARRLRIDAADAPVRHGRAKDLAVNHAGQAQVMGILGAAGHLGARFEARNSSPDLIHRRTYRALSSKAWRMARRR
jgi:hypothetical protein